MSRFLKLYSFLVIFFLINAEIILSQDSDSTFSEETVTRDSIFSTTDSLQIDSLKYSKETKRDTIISVHFTPYDQFSLFSTKSEIEFSDYKFTGDLLKSHPFAFLRDMGFAGMPSEMNLYGKGFNEISYTGNHGLLNNRNSNIYDLHLQQSEFIDSIEFVQLPRGFLYGGWNPVSVRFIPKEIISRTPKSRIRYYEGSYGEAMIDGQVFLLPYKNFNIYIDITNRISGERFKNTSFGMWTGSTGANYYYSDNITFFGNYYYHRGDVSLNGGIDYKRILSGRTDVNSILFDEILAPVISETQYNRMTVHRMNTGFRGKFLPDNFTELSIYNGYELNEFRNNENETIGREFTDHRENFYGISLHNKYEHSFFSLSLLGNYESIKTSTEFNRASTNYFDYNDYSLSGLISFKLADTSLIPSVYGRLFNHNQNMKYGLGGDFRFKFNGRFEVYSGISIMKDKVTRSQFLRGNYNTINAEIGLSSNFTNLHLKANYFISIYENRSLLFGSTVDTFQTYRYSSLSFESQQGISVSLITKFYKFRYEIAASFVQSKLKDNNYSILPSQIKSGIYYSDQLFEDNLDLNVGFNFSYTGKQVMFQYLLNRPEVFYVYETEAIPTNYILDFVMQGEIQKSAIVYFTWENLLNRQYYLTPFYPMPVRGIRFGIAWNFLN